MNTFNRNELLKICEELGAEQRSQDITIKYINSSFFNKMKKSIEKDRRGEVVFCVLRPNNKIITVTCSEYPKGIFRIPTGGIQYGEDIIKAVFRETREELGIDVKVSSFAGVLKIRFEHGNKFIMFYSYLFILEEMGGRLLIDASDNEVSEIKEVTVDELGEVADLLNNIAGKWSDWGKFRYATTNAIYEYLKSKAY